MNRPTICPDCNKYVGNSYDVHNLLVHQERDPASLMTPPKVKRNLRRPRRKQSVDD